MQIAQTFTVVAPIDRVWSFITDPERVAPCVPGCQSYEVVGSKQYKASVKVAVGPIKTTFNVNVELTEEEPPFFVASITRGEEGGKASTLTANSELRLKPAPNGDTEVSYSSDIALVGRLGKFGLGMMKKQADKLGKEFAEAFRARVEGYTREEVHAGRTNEVSPAGIG